MIKIILIAVLLIIIAIGIKFSLDVFNKQNRQTPTATAIVNGKTIQLLVADTDEAKQIGLSETESLPKDHGMLFQFKSPNYYSFWMKNMRFPIDIIYLNNNKVVTILENVQVPKDSETPPIYNSDELADTVIELNAGMSQEYNIQKGDTVQINL